MSKKKYRCGFLAVLITGIIVLPAAMTSAQKHPSATAPQAATPAPEQPAPKVSAELSTFTVDRANAQFVFTLQIRNQEPKDNTVYAVVYGKNDMFSPPRRGAWPLSGLLFGPSGTRRGALFSSDITRNWSSRPEHTKGAKIAMKPNATNSIEGALPINQTSPHEAWRGKSLDPRSMYNEVYLWVFSQNGQLIFEKKYDVK